MHGTGKGTSSVVELLPPNTAANDLRGAVTTSKGGEGTETEPGCEGRVVCVGFGTRTGTASSACQSNMAGQAEVRTIENSRE